MRCHGLGQTHKLCQNGAPHRRRLGFVLAMQDQDSQNELKSKHRNAAYGCKVAVFLMAPSAGSAISAAFRRSPWPRILMVDVPPPPMQLDVSGVDVAKFDDAYFKPTEKKEKGKGEKEFFGKVQLGGSPLAADGSRLRHCGWRRPTEVPCCAKARRTALLDLQLDHMAPNGGRLPWLGAAAAEQRMKHRSALYGRHYVCPPGGGGMQFLAACG